MIYFLLDPVSSDLAIAQLGRVMAIGTAQLRRGYEAFLRDVGSGKVDLRKATPLDYDAPQPLQAAYRRSLAAACAA